MRASESTLCTFVVASAMLAAACQGDLPSPLARAAARAARAQAPAEAVWMPVAPMSTSRERHTATLLPSGLVLVAGGLDSDDRALATAELYDPATGTWAPTGPMVSDRYAHTATLLASGKVMVAGGNPDATVEIYDPETGGWTDGGSTLVARYHGTATLLGPATVLLVGGDSPDGITASAELYDAVTRTSTDVASLSHERWAHTATLLRSGQVLVAGGRDAREVDLASAELYDPATRSWTLTGAMARGRKMHSAALLPSGRVLVAGGYGGTGVLSSSETFDEPTRRWIATGDLASARFETNAVLLADGEVLVAGGSIGGATAELFEPAAGAWTATAPMTADRRWHTTTLLPAGTVLVTGGGSATAEVLATPPVAATEPPPTQPPSGPGAGDGQALVVARIGAVPPRGTARLSASGGTGSGYAWSFEANASGGTISDGVYRAGTRGEVVDVVKVTDSGGETTTQAITVTAGISILVEGAPLVQPEGRRGLSATGGSGTGYRWSLLSNASLGTVEATTGEYAAGPLGGGVDLVQVVDSLGNVATASVSVLPWRVQGSGGCSSAPGEGATTVTLLVAAVALVRVRARRRRAIAASVALVLLGPGVARAQGFDGERLQPLAGARDILAVQSALVAPHLAKSATVYASYADRPLQLAAGSRQVPVVRGQTTLTAGASLGLLDRFELSLAVPFAAQRVGSFASYAPGMAVPTGTALGDVRVAPKARLYGDSRSAIAVAVAVTIPTGDESSYLGQGGVTASPRVIVEHEIARGFRLAGNAGLALRGARQQLDLQIGNAVTYALGAEIPFRLAGQRLAGIATLGGEAELNGQGGDPGLEAIAGVTWHGPLGLAVTVGGGSGLTNGFGVPRYRVLTAIAFGPGRTAPAAREDGLVAATTSPTEPAPEPPAAPASQPRPEAPAIVATVERPSPAAAVLELPRRFGTVRFAFDSARLPADASPLLDAIAAELRGAVGLQLRIEGHADQRGPAAYNQSLSERRARAVRDALAERGVERAQMTVAGFGETRPADPAHTRAAYARNRRAECVVPAPWRSSATASAGAPR